MMDRCAERHMWWNLAKGLAVLAGCLLVILMIEQAWDAGAFGNPPTSGGEDASEPSAADGSPYGQRSLVAFAFEDDDSSIGVTGGVSADFVAECFSPTMAGEPRSAEDGSVVGISSSLPAGELFSLCSDALRSHGWLRVESGWATRATFVKDGGRYRWLHMDVSSIAGSSAAVIVLQEAS